jgi:hypothetical protein
MLLMMDMRVIRSKMTNFLISFLSCSAVKLFYMCAMEEPSSRKIYNFIFLIIS